MATPADVLKMLKEKEVKFVDLRFTDTRGKEQHVTVPSKQFTNDKFESGHAFDGSSIAGWKGIQASDMLLMPDPDTARMDPFMDETTLLITCDVIEPSDGKGYERDPRSLAKRAEAYLKSSGLGDIAYFGPEPEFFVFDSVEWSVDMSGSYVKISSAEAPWSSGDKFEGGNMGHRPPVKGGYFPVPPVDSLQDIRSAMCLAMEQMGVEVEVHHHEVAAPGQCEIGTKFETLVKRADWLQILKYCVHNTAHAYGKTATFMPKPVVGDNGSGMHVHQSVWKDGKNLFAGDGYAGLSEFALYYIGGVIKHAKALNAITNPGTNSYKRLVPGFEAPINLAYSARNRSAAIRIPYVSNPKGRRIEVRFPDPTCNPYLGFSAMLMAGLDGIQNKIHPGDPMDKNLYDLEPEEAAKVPHPVRGAGRGARAARQGPRVPHARRCLHQRHDRRLHRAQDGRSDALPDDHASGRVRHVLQPVTMSAPELAQAFRQRQGQATCLPLFLRPSLGVRYTRSPCKDMTSLPENGACAPFRGASPPRSRRARPRRIRCASTSTWRATRYFRTSLREGISQAFMHGCRRAAQDELDRQEHAHARRLSEGRFRDPANA
jgi:glutamine synthetase